MDLRMEEASHLGAEIANANRSTEALVHQFLYGITMWAYPQLQALVQKHLIYIH